MKRASAVDSERLGTYYVRDVGIQAGCIPLEAHDHDNFDAILKVLEQNGARGRRNLVRAECGQNSSVKFEFNGSGCAAELLDVNVTHFRCNLLSDSDEIKVFEKIRDAKLYVEGSPFLSDAVLIMKRHLGNENLCVFMFIRGDDDIPGLEPSEQKKLNKTIYQIVVSKNMEILKKAFSLKSKKSI